MSAQPMRLARFAQVARVPPELVDRWARAGVFGEHMRSPGSGARRLFDDGDLRVVLALRAVREVLPVLPHALAAKVGEAMRSGDGRWLVIRSDGVLVADQVLSGRAPAFVAVDLERLSL